MYVFIPEQSPNSLGILIGKKKIDTLSYDKKGVGRTRYSLSDITFVKKVSFVIIT